jgi:hypothetical protein
VFGQAADERLVVNVLVDADPAQADAARLLRWLVARYPGHAIHVPQLMRDDVAARALRAAGFDVLALHQMQMRLPWVESWPRAVQSRRPSLEERTDHATHLPCPVVRHRPWRPAASFMPRDSR